MLMKQWIGSHNLSQQPLLALTGGRSSMVDSMVPTTKFLVMKPHSCLISESNFYKGNLVVIECADQLLCILCCCARWGNNHSKAFKDQCNGLATAVAATYGDRYAESVTYLRSLAQNDFWTAAEIPRLPWHEMRGREPGVAEPQYQLHPAVLAAIAPSAPLRAAFGGRRDI